jgi:predicted nucleic acid-binding protein
MTGNVTVHGAQATARAPVPEKAYLDNCLVGVLVKGELPEELAAIHELINLWHAGRIRLVTSPVTMEEIARVPEEHRAPHEAIYAFLEKVPTIDEDVLFPSIISAAPGPKGPVVVQDADLGWLDSILRDRDDARHLFQAFKNECSYFVTTDVRTILSRTPEIEGKFPIKLRRPSQLVAELAQPDAARES